jgi:polar amino acid transport system substrate-binding protein
MQAIRGALIVVAALLATATPDAIALAQKVPAEVVKELAPTGKLRAGINLGNGVLAQKSRRGELAGVTVDLARELGRRIGVPVELVPLPAAGRSFATMAANELDIAFFAIEPKRAAEVTFSPPYVLIDGAYLVDRESPLKTPEDVDRPGMLIGVGLNSAHDLYLTRTLKHATLVRAKVGGYRAAIDLFIKGTLDAAAGTRQPLAAFARTHRGVRVMEQPFNQVRQAIGTPRGRQAAARYVRGFVEEMKASGFVAAALKRSGQADARVAPAAKD